MERNSLTELLREAESRKSDLTEMVQERQAQHQFVTEKVEQRRVLPRPDRETSNVCPVCLVDDC